MPDIMTVAQRSALMSRIRGRGNKSTEDRLARLLRKCGICGWRRHEAIVGRPDFVFRSQRVAVFVDGCFWHGCPKHFTAPKARASFWREKIAGNRRRDLSVASKLRRKGWTVIRIWEHALRKRAVIPSLARISAAIGLTP
jgi:DNA mismatch endonuclease, patch repair protein